VLAVGAEPVICDVDPHEAHMTAETAAAVAGSRTRAIVPVHYRGHCADLPPLVGWAAAHGLVVIQDAAHAFGSRLPDGACVGASGDYVCFSFGPLKAITCGQGGGIAFETGALAETCRLVREFGLVDGPEGKRAVASAYRTAMTDVQAAIGLGQMERLDWKIGHRQAILAVYRRELQDVGEVRFLPFLDGECPLYCTIRVPARFRDACRRHLAANGIETGIHYPALAAHPLLGACRGRQRNALQISRELVSLPLHDRIAEADARHAARCLRSFFNPASNADAL
jgi:perosamine synthetase